MYFRSFLLGTDNRLVPDEGITTMIEVITMVIEKGTGTLIPSHVLLGAATAVPKLKSQTQDQTGWWQVRAEMTGLGVHIDETHFLHTSLRMVQSAQTRRRVVLPM